MYDNTSPEMLSASGGGLGVGDSVVARFHVDRRWYRATVTEVCHVTL